MKWQNRRASRNVEDRRRMSGGGKAAGGGLGLIAIVVIGYFLGIDTSFLLDGQQVGTQGGGQVTQADERAGQFAAVTLADTETIWTEVFETQVGEPYAPPVLVLFKGVTTSPCGGANGASGPFYCPADKKAYLDTDFFSTMENRLGAGGDFAAAYVIAHEVAHHVQNELGILGQANRVRAQASEGQANQISVRIELQADCYSGIWARYAQERLGTLERGDLAEALNAARQIGDDTLQRNAGKRPNPHSFTHGTSAQRERWFAKGYETADLRQCDTFGTNDL